MSDLTLPANARTTVRAVFQPTAEATSTRSASLPAGTHVHARQTAEGWDLLAWVDSPTTSAPDYIRANAHRFEWLPGIQAVATDA